MRRRSVTMLAMALFFFLIAKSAWCDAPTRIVSLKPSITDTVYALGLGDRLAGVTRYCEVPTNDERPAIVADYTRPYVERIVALSPDIILGSMENSSRRSIDNLRRMGLNVRLFPFGNMEESIESIVGIADALGAKERGLALTERMKKKLDDLKRKYGSKRKMRAVVVWGRRPLVVAGSGTFMDEALRYIGSENVVRNSNVRYPKIGIEELIAIDPDVIVDLSMGSEKDSRDTGPWEKTDAIDARILSLDMNDFRAGPRLIDGLEKLASEIHDKGKAASDRNAKAGQE